MHAAGELAHVVLRSIPSALFLRVQRHLEELVRELQLVAFGIDPAHPLADLRLMPLLTGPLSDFQAVRDAATAQAAEAERLGEKRVDLHADLPPAFVGVVRTLTEAMEEADEVAASGALLTLPSEPDMAALRRWIAEEISRQVDLGAEPRPCPLPG